VDGFSLKTEPPGNIVAPSSRKYNHFVKYFFAALLFFIVAVLSLGFWYGYQVYYNPRPAEILVDGDKVQLVREREKVEELHY